MSEMKLIDSFRGVRRQLSFGEVPEVVVGTRSTAQPCMMMEAHGKGIEIAIQPIAL